ncbi:hypothetical protein F9C11_21865 [Amycolatopsis sp. VS8301801F10]|uniref:hypothetical protein n=1 Tax=Amycolatopsis sp. VS8301801F10 TaxID=2652442 RepID=UPI0038FC3E57
MTTQTCEPDGNAEPEQEPEPAEPGPDASPDEWVRYVNRTYPRHGVTAPGSHMGHR